MPFKIDHLDEDVFEWTTMSGSVEYTRVSDYTPTIYVGVRDGDLTKLDDLVAAIATDPKIAAVDSERWFTDLRARDRETVLRIDVERIDEVRSVAREIRTLHEFGTHAPGTYQLYNVDFSEEFRYCLETGTDPTPATSLSSLRLHIPERALADHDVTQLRVGGDRLADTERGVFEALCVRLDDEDPDILVCNTARIVPLLSDRSTELGIDAFQLGRVPGWRQLARESVFESYGTIRHSSARYTVPGRVIIDESNSFLWDRAGLSGLLDLTARSWKPLQEAGWASIGNLLTAIQIREAVRHRDVLIPWHKSDPEYYKDVETLHAADRGGFTFDPDVGLYEDVYELDFSSMYPAIMIERNISPETVCCDCHTGREDVPELGYNVCDDRGFVPDVLEPIVTDRDDLKARLGRTDDPERRAELESRSDALKWVLVTCFGYQGYKHAKFGRIEAHEAINAYAREILLTAKEFLEDNGWHVVHGIVDSIWVRARADRDQTPLDELVSAITAEVDIRLEFENAYDWMCFVPRRGRDTGALTTYFGKIRDEEAFTLRGIEARRRSTPAFVEDAQREFIAVLDAYRDPSSVCDRLRRSLLRLRDGNIASADLVIRKRASKPVEEYTRETHTVAALMRYRYHGIEKHPGQDVEYVIVDGGARLPERVRLPFESVDTYDHDAYADLLVRACESVVSPLGWDRNRIHEYLRETDDISLRAFE